MGTASMFSYVYVDISAKLQISIKVFPGNKDLQTTLVFHIKSVVFILNKLIFIKEKENIFIKETMS